MHEAEIVNSGLTWQLYLDPVIREIIDPVCFNSIYMKPGYDVCLL